MKPVLSPAESAALDSESQARGVSVESLMENAGRAVARETLLVAGGAYGRRAVVVCGKGNNGGDGLVAARQLARMGMRVAVFGLAPPEAFGEPAAANHRRLDEVCVRPRSFSKEALRREVERSHLVVDAVFGTGFRGRPEGDPAEAIAVLQNAAVPVIAVDIPSGVNGETGAVDGIAVRADVTVTFGAAKPGLLLFPGAAYAGVVASESDPQWRLVWGAFHIVANGQDSSPARCGKVVQNQSRPAEARFHSGFSCNLFAGGRFSCMNGERTPNGRHDSGNSREAEKLDRYQRRDAR